MPHLEPGAGSGASQKTDRLRNPARKHWTLFVFKIWTCIFFWRWKLASPFHPSETSRMSGVRQPSYVGRTQIFYEFVRYFFYWSPYSKIIMFKINYFYFKRAFSDILKIRFCKRQRTYCNYVCEDQNCNLFRNPGFWSNWSYR